MTENEIGKIVVDSAIAMQPAMGPGNGELKRLKREIAAMEERKSKLPADLEEREP